MRRVKLLQSGRWPRIVAALAIVGGLFVPLGLVAYGVVESIAGGSQGFAVQAAPVFDTAGVSRPAAVFTFSPQLRAAVEDSWSLQVRDSKRRVVWEHYAAEPLPENLAWGGQTDRAVPLAPGEACAALLSVSRKDQGRVVYEAGFALGLGFAADGGQWRVLLPPMRFPLASAGADVLDDAATAQLDFVGKLLSPLKDSSVTVVVRAIAHDSATVMRRAAYVRRIIAGAAGMAADHIRLDSFDAKDPEVTDVRVMVDADGFAALTAVPRED